MNYNITLISDLLMNSKSFGSLSLKFAESTGEEGGERNRLEFTVKYFKSLYMNCI